MTTEQVLFESPVHSPSQAKTYKIPAVKIQLVKESSYSSDQRPIIRTPDDVAYIMRSITDLLPEEHSFVLVMSTKNKVNAIQEISIGSLNAAIIHPREVFKAAILSNGAAVIIVHNHPSGDPSPSPEDITLTSALQKAGQILDIPVLDHIIMGDNGKYVSLKERGIM